MVKKALTVFFLVATCSAYAQQPDTTASTKNGVKHLYFAALKEKLAENYTNAVNTFFKVVALDPNNDAAYFEIANVSLRQNKVLDAETYIKKAIALNPSNIWYLKLQSEVYKRNGNMDALVITFDQLIKLDPNLDSYYFDRANALFIAGKFDESKKAYDLLEQKFGVSKESTAAKQRFNTGATTSEMLAKQLDEGPGDVKSYLQLSEALIAKKEYDQVLNVLLKAKEASPENFEVNLALADVYRALKRPSDAHAALRVAFSSPEMPLQDKLKIVHQLIQRFDNPEIAKLATDLVKKLQTAYSNEPKVTLLYGDLLYQQGDYTNAVKQYEETIKQNDNFYLAWEKLVATQTVMGNYKAAAQTSANALDLFPNQAVLHYYNAFSLHRNTQNAEAALALNNALQLDPDDNNLKAMILALQAEVFIDQGKLNDADLAFDKAVKLAPNNYLTLSNYAYYLALRNQNLQKAEKLAAKAFAEMPNNSSVLDTYAVVLFKLGKVDEALKHIELALQNNNDVNTVYLEHYGDILYAKGKKDMALVQWQKSQQLGNTSEKLIRKINEKRYIK